MYFQSSCCTVRGEELVSTDTCPFQHLWQLCAVSFNRRCTQPPALIPPGVGFLFCVWFWPHHSHGLPSTTYRCFTEGTGAQQVQVTGKLPALPMPRRGVRAVSGDTAGGEAQNFTQCSKKTVYGQQGLKTCSEESTYSGFPFAYFLVSG